MNQTSGPKELDTFSVSCLTNAGMTPDELSWATSPMKIHWLIETIRAERNRSRLNPFMMSIRKQLELLRKHNKQGEWGIQEETFDRLEKTAPAWPPGRDCFRTLRVRFGHGLQGVLLTFERHMTAIEQTFPERFHRSPKVQSGPELFEGRSIDRLGLINGNHSHVPVVEWILVDASEYLFRENVIIARSGHSLADEGLVFTWMFPERITKINYRQFCAMILAGYEYNLPESGNPWAHTIAVDLHGSNKTVVVTSEYTDNDSAGFSVPVFRERF